MNRAYRLIINHYLLAVFSLTLVASLTVTTGNVTGAERISLQESQIIVASSAQVLLKQNTTTTLLNYCATTFKHLSKSAQKSATGWQMKHAQIVNKADKINRYVASTIEKYDSIFAAEKFYLKIDSQVYDSTQIFKAEIANKSRKQQHYFCNRLILSTAMGEWDLVNVIPEHVQRVKSFKLKN